MFALVDCNNFFVSCERVFNPKLEGKPVVVLSNNDGCIVSRSNEAKRLGIKMGDPLFKARPLIAAGKVFVFSSNFGLYSDMSWRVMETLRQFGFDLEIYSIDEAFLDLSHLNPGALTGQGRTFQQQIKQWTGIPVSVGIAPTKTLAKAANEIAKHSQKAQGVLNLALPHHQALALARLPVRDVWGIGYRLTSSLEAAGIKTALQLRDADDRWILKRYSITLLKTVHELRGIPCLPLTVTTAPRKSIIASRSFGTLIESLPGLKEAVATYVARAAEKLRQDQLLAGTLTVYIRTNKFRQEPQYANAATLPLPVATDCTHDLIRFASDALERIYQEGYRYYKARITLTDLMPAHQVQQNLFETPDREKTGQLMNTLDRINLQWGSGTLKYAAQGLAPNWVVKRDHRSPCYTTRWKDLLLVND